jgi:hypothetical protein
MKFTVTVSSIHDDRDYRTVSVEATNSGVAFKKAVDMVVAEHGYDKADLQLVWVDRDPI